MLYDKLGKKVEIRTYTTLVNFTSLFFFFTVHALSLSLFRRLLSHFSTSIASSLYSISLSLVRKVESVSLNGSIFDLNVRLLWSFRFLVSLPFSFALTHFVILFSIYLCFVVLVEFVWPSWVRFGFGVTTFSWSSSLFWRHHCSIRDVLLSYWIYNPEDIRPYAGSSRCY